MVTPLMTTTLPTIVGTGVVAQTTETMFGKGKRRASGRRRVIVRREIIVVGVSPTKAGTEKLATQYRKALKANKMPYIGKVKVKKVRGGYAAVYRG